MCTKEIDLDKARNLVVPTDYIKNMISEKEILDNKIKIMDKEEVTIKLKKFSL